MRLRNIPGAKEAIVENKYAVKDPEQHKGHWNEVFENNHPIHIEIGMGKGKFITAMAELHPENNYIGIEKYSSVMLRALQKQEEAQLPNLYFIRMEAEVITEVFDQGEIARIYLNFSDPWPKDRHAKRRLPSREFLRRYDVILDKDGQVEFKTDNRELFDFALESMQKRYPILVTFINKINTRSYEAHTRKIGLEVICEFQFNGNSYYELVFDTSKRVCKAAK